MKGLTLIESLMVIIILIITLMAISGFVIGFYRTYFFVFQQATAVEEVRGAIETMIREIKEAQPGSDGSYIIESANDYEFIFYSDIDKDETVERIRYFIEGIELKKGIIEPGDQPLCYKPQEEKIIILSKYIRNQPPIFRYFDGNGNELLPPTRLQDTKLIKLYLAININPQRIDDDFILETKVQLRNLKTNL